MLLALRRRGLVRSAWVDAGPGRRLVHALPHAEPGEDRLAPAVEGAGASPSALDELLPLAGDVARGAADEFLSGGAVRAAGRLVAGGDRIAETAARCTERLGFAPRLREEMRVAIEQHLEEAAAALRDSRPPDAAERDAVRAFGDPWKIATDLARTAQGKRTVVFPSGLRDSLHGIVIYDLRVLLVILAVIVFVRVQVITAYHIPTKSMEPTLHGDPVRGDRILVNKLAGTPARFDIAVFDGFGTDRKNFVKRVTALPGEKLGLGEGDLWIDGALVRKDGDAYEALLFEVFDREREAARAAKDAGATSGADFEAEFRERLQDAWRFEGEGECGLQADDAAPFAGFRLSARPDADPARAPRLVFDEMVRDSYVDPETGQVWGGSNSVCDMRLTVAVKPVPPGDDAPARVALVLTRGNEHRYEAVVSGEGGDVVLLADGEEVARAKGEGLADGVPTRVAFSQVDRVLRVAIADRLLLRHDLPAPENPREDGPDGVPMAIVTRGAAWIDPIALERDVYYVADVAEDNLRRLGPDQFFMMGDNSSNSSDSRTYGPVHRNRLVGSPLLVVWPPSRIRVPR